jgi:hypothetical protein
MNLVYDIMAAGYSGEMRHAQAVMKELGIEYTLSVSQAASDCWWFFCCKNTPETLPRFLTVLDAKPRNLIGFGLNSKMVDLIEGAE